MKLKLSAVLVAAVFGLAGAQSTAFAQACPDRTQVNEQTNAEFMKLGIESAEEALEHAKQGHAKETKDATKESLRRFGCIVSNRGGAQTQGPRGKIKIGGIKAGRGDFEAAIPLLEEGIARMKKVDMTPRGLGD